MPQNTLPADVALFGQDATSHLVALHPVRGDDERAPARMRLYRRPTSSVVEVEDVPFYPFFFLAEMDLMKGFARQRFKFQHLSGEGYYQYLVIFFTFRDYWDAVRHVQEAAGGERRRPEQLYLIPNPAMQYLMQTGRTLFKDMAYEDLHRMQLDIEVATSDSFPDARRPKDEIIIVALSDNRGWKHLIEGRTQSERAILETLVEVIREKDPDVIEGHNIFAFDFPYLMTRCERLGVSFAIGRDGSRPRTFSSSIRFAERMVDFPALDIAGRHVVDTYFQVMGYDVFKRNMPGYGLKVAAQYFGFAAPNRTYIEGDQLTRVWQDDPEQVLAYALDDVIETERLARHLSGSTFYLTQMVPMPYGQVARTGPAAKIESLFVREYLRQKHSLPKSQWGSQAMGGYTDVFVTGVVGPVVYADVESLYPSIMLNYDVKPASDALDLFPGLLQRLTDLRFEAKRSMKTAPTLEARGELDARQTSYKNLINSFYGMLGFSLALFNDFAEADRVAATGQDLLRRMMREIRKANGTVIEVDTDGVLFIPPKHIKEETEERAFVAQISAAMPEGIRIGFDGRFRKMLSYKKKNYALQSYAGKLKFKGSSLVSRSSERFGRRFVSDAIKLLVEEDVTGLHDLYMQTAERIRRHDWTVEDFARRETLKENVAQYQEDVQAGRRTRAASYEVALARMRETGQPVQKGDRILYYLTGNAPNVVAFENARLVEAWDPAHPDENTFYYLKRLAEFARKFEPFFSPFDFRQVFPADAHGQTSLFGTSLSDIRLQRHERAIEDVQDDVPF